MTALPLRADIIAGLGARGVRGDLAAQYADAYLEYRDATQRVESGGRVVLHPVTRGPMVNPYLQVRDRALARLQQMRRDQYLDVEWLWT